MPLKRGGESFLWGPPKEWGELTSIWFDDQDDLLGETQNWDFDPFIFGHRLLVIMPSTRLWSSGGSTRMEWVPKNLLCRLICLGHSSKQKLPCTGPSFLPLWENQRKNVFLVDYVKYFSLNSHKSFPEIRDSKYFLRLYLDWCGKNIHHLLIF